MLPRHIEIVEKCKELSPAINAYFEEELYRGSVNMMEELTDSFFINTAVGLLLEELVTIGIVTNYNSNDLITSPVDLTTAFYLRDKFDTTRFYKLLKSFDEKEYSVFSGIFENISLAEDILIELSSYLSNLFQSDIGWEYIDRGTEFWISDDNFLKHIAAIKSMVEVNTDSTTSGLTDTTVDKAKEFLHAMEEKDRVLQLCATYFSKTYPGMIDQLQLQNILARYDRDKLKPENLPLFIERFGNKEEIEKEEPEFVKQHHLRTAHHIEYWLDEKNTNKPKLTSALLCVLIWSLYLDNVSISVITETIDKLKAQMTPELYKFTTQRLIVTKEDFTSITGGL